ncbi:hypothetical protein SAMN03159443_05464 [Pseudomonas sp. NFACC15-1]|nr:hypothetical protein SAMN03159443_05464 [Pseudomonas sp. NFACC15-1]SDZ22229.1 hypothetical protein SAMN03159380_05760 [Pseudomonas sp. NFACC14]
MTALDSAFHNLHQNGLRVLANVANVGDAGDARTVERLGGKAIAAKMPWSPLSNRFCSGRQPCTCSTADGARFFYDPVRPCKREINIKTLLDKVFADFKLLYPPRRG